MTLISHNPKEVLYSAYRLRARHLAPNGASKEVFGTCFHVKVEDDIFLVTNKHNFSLEYADDKYVGYQIIALFIAGYFGIDQYAECDFADQTVAYASPSNDAEDVVVFDMTNIPFQFRRKRRPGEDPATKTTSIAPITIGIDMLATDADLKRANPGNTIAFPSYPALYDLNGVRPIMRTGTIASDPESDYQTDTQAPARRIVCEAHSTSGSSGSPIFSIVGDRNELILLGINSGHLTAEDARMGTFHSGLSYCFKASCIVECIDKLRSAKDARRMG
jgi:hypothetical protein